MRRALILTLFLWLTGTGSAAAQTLAPMRGDVVSFTDRALMRLKVMNPYPRATTFDIVALGPDWQEEEGVTPLQPRLTIAAGEVTTVSLLADMSATRGRSVFVCAITTIDNMRGEVCGKYRLLRYSR